MPRLTWTTPLSSSQGTRKMTWAGRGRSSARGEGQACPRARAQGARVQAGTPGAAARVAHRALGLAQPAEDGEQLGALVKHGLQRLCHLQHGVEELVLVGIARLDSLQHLLRSSGLRQRR